MINYYSLLIIQFAYNIYHNIYFIFFCLRGCINTQSMQIFFLFFGSVYVLMC